jgi:predicted permease
MSWLQQIFHRRRIYDDLAEEVHEHLEERTEQLMRTENMSRQEAQQAAKRAFGNPTLIEERSREPWRWPRIENLLRDLSFSARLLRKSPGFAAVAILTITLGVGANTAVFSLLNGLLLRPLPVPDAQQLVLLRIQPAEFGYSFCAPLFRALESHHETFSSVYGFSNRPLQIRGPNGSEEISGVLVSGQYFEALATPAQLGRTLTPADDRKETGVGGFPVVISDSFWKTRFNRASDILRRPLTIGNAAFTIVGVMPRTFLGADANFRPQFFLPLSTEPIVDAPFNNLDGGYHSWWLRVGARLKPGVSLAQVNGFLNSVEQPLFKEIIPDPNFGFGNVKRDDLRLIAESGAAGHSSLRLRYRNPLLATFVLCIAVLLLACINLASLLLARAAAREREIATRLAIGATRGRLVQQLLIDSLLLAALGTAAGLATAPLVSSQLVAILAPANTHLSLDAGLDWHVLLFAACIAIGSTLLIGLLPALQATAGDLNLYMKDGARNTRAEHRRVLPKVLLGIEVSIAMVLVTGAGLLATSLLRLYKSGLGFDPHNLLLANFDMNKQALDGAPLIRLYRTIAERLATQPGIASVGYHGETPISGDTSIGSYHTPGGTDRETYNNIVSPDYFRTMRIPLLAGREFRWQDTAETGKKIILNQAAAGMLFPSGSAVGQQVRSKVDNKENVYEVIAVVGNAKYASLRDAAPPTAYIPMTQVEDHKPAYSAVVRFQGSAMPLAAAIRSITTELAPDIPAPALDNMSQLIDDSIAADRVMVLLSLFFAVSALLVTGIGLYGVLAYATARRTSEIGIRIALGAARLQVVGLVFLENAWTAGTGCIAGLLAAVLASRCLSAFLYGTSPHDPWVLSLSLAILCLSAACASLIPAIRAACIDPMKALRTE